MRTNGIRNLVLTIFDLEFLHEVVWLPLRFNSVYDVLLGVTARFQVKVEGRILYDEEMFPVVEFAKQLMTWLTEGAPKGKCFKYISLSDTPEEEGRVEIIRSGNRWKIQSSFQEFQCDSLLKLDVIEHAAINLARQIVENLPDTLGGYDIRKLIFDKGVAPEV